MVFNIFLPTTIRYRLRKIPKMSISGNEHNDQSVFIDSQKQIVSFLGCNLSSKSKTYNTPLEKNQ